MNLLDENIRRDQRELLARWNIRFREIGNEIGRLGVDDDEIVRLLHGLKSVTFFTLDYDFYRRHLCHSGYCLVYLDIEDHEAATFIRRFLLHPSFDTLAKRTGTVVRITHTRLRVWQLHAKREAELTWPAP